ncbi:hypothetical protein [Streptomyces cyaneofuscatus]|uniref:hypothetical protein n=1 Tax=Streptomyces cyaneofuscatus TaxID=66883 RepID=UPI0033BD621C
MRADRNTPRTDGALGSRPSRPARATFAAPGGRATGPRARCAAPSPSAPHVHRPAPVTAVGGAGRRTVPSADPVCGAVGGGSAARTAGEPFVRSAATGRGRRAGRRSEAAPGRTTGSGTGSVSRGWETDHGTDGGTPDAAPHHPLPPPLPLRHP